MIDIAALRDAAEKQREQAIATANYCAGMIKVYDEMLAAKVIVPPDPPVEGDDA